MYYLKRAILIAREEGAWELAYRALKKLITFDMYKDQNKSYKKWIEANEVPYMDSELNIYKDNIDKYQYKPMISILLPVYNVERRYLVSLIESIKSQWYKNWEICICDDSSTNNGLLAYLKRLERSTDERIKVIKNKNNSHISLTTNNAFNISEGAYVMLVDNDDLLPENSLYEIIKELNRNKWDVVYFDEDKLDAYGERIEPFFKPDWSPELLWSMNYPTHAVYSREIFEKAGKLREGYEGSQDYDLILRVAEKTNKVKRIPKVLYHWRKVEGSTAVDHSGKDYAFKAAKISIEDNIKKKSLKGNVVNDFYPFTTVLEPLNKIDVDIIIPFKDNYKITKRLLDSVESYEDSLEGLNFVLVNNKSKNISKYNEIRKTENLRILNYNKDFNFSIINNHAVRESGSKFLLFLNNDIQFLTRNSISKLLSWAEQSEIGAIGCKLLYPHRKVQHAGIVLGTGGVAYHSYYQVPDKNDFYYNHLHAIRNYSAVTAAMMMVERDKFEEVGGFNEELPYSFNDVDLCLKLLQKGYRNVYIPYVEAIHHESQSREPEVQDWEDAYMRKKWGKYIENDPYYNPNLEHDLSKGKVFEVRSV